MADSRSARLITTLYVFLGMVLLWQLLEVLGTWLS